MPGTINIKKISSLEKNRGSLLYLFTNIKPIIPLNKKAPLSPRKSFFLKFRIYIKIRHINIIIEKIKNTSLNIRTMNIKIEYVINCKSIPSNIFSALTNSANDKTVKGIEKLLKK